MAKCHRNVSHVYSGEVKPVSTVLDTIQVVAPHKRQKTRVIQKSFGTQKTEVAAPSAPQKSPTPPIEPAAANSDSSTQNASPDPHPPPKKVSIF